MRVSQRLIAASVLVALSCALAGCGTNGAFDPTDALDFLDTKKKLPGERKPVFVNGVPGVEQGVPKELYKGVQQPLRPDPPPVAAAPAPSRAPTATASRAAPVADEPDAPQDTAPAPDTKSAAPFPEPVKSLQKQKRRSITALPKDDEQPAPPPPSRPAASSAPQQQSASPFPAPLSASGFQR